MTNGPIIPDEPDWLIRMRAEGQSMSMLIDEIVRRRGVDGGVKKLRKYGVLTAYAARYGRRTDGGRRPRISTSYWMNGPNTSTFADTGPHDQCGRRRVQARDG